MTVLGKVAVPKPLNLPSQRLENHGVDPNVEIVPKGTLSWGTRTSSSGTNVWGSSSADSKASSPSHLSGRPTSGGSGTRPSTAGSDRVNETAGSAWGPNSRPSSASGILSSDQSSLSSLRPHSAEPRPASSHLSRFAESVSDSQGTWGASGTSERLGMVPSKKEDFSLSSGDFPTLGSEKDQSSNISESKDHGSRTIRGSAPGGEALVKDEMGLAFDRSKRDGSESVREGLQPSMENWQGDHQQYYNPNIPPQHFDAWRGPMNAPPGVWYRGPQGGPAGPPFGPPVGPGGFPIEPFPYYPPQIPPQAFPNSQPVPPPRGVPRGHQPNSGNPYRPKMHDGFMHPGMPYRPGFYPPPMAYDGYYGPPRGYCNLNEPDIPFMSMGANHPVYDGRYPVPNAPGPSDSHARAGGPAGKKKSNDVEFFDSGDSRMQSKFLSKQQGEWDGKEQAENREHNPPVLALHPAKAEKNIAKPRKYEWGDEDDGDDIYSPAQVDGGGNYVLETVRAKASQSSKPTDNYGIKKSESVSASPVVSSPKELESPFPSTAKDATLMRKIEGLNAKARSSDGRADSLSIREDQKYGLDAAIGKVDTFPHKYSNAAPMERNSISEASFSRGAVGPRDNRMVHQTAAPISRRSYHGMSDRPDHGGKGKFGNQPADGWQRRPMSAEIPNVVLASKPESDHNFLEVAEIHQPSKDDGRFSMKLQDSTGNQAQRDKRRELAQQRALQLKREEEERIRDQKAKAQAKLEDLNRRTQSGDASNPVANKSVSSETSKNQQEGRDVEYTESVYNAGSPSLVVQLKTEGALVYDENKKQVVDSAITSKVVPVQTSRVNESVETLLLKQDVVNARIRDGKSSSELDEGSVSGNRSTGYKQKQNNTAVKIFKENSIAVDSREGRKSPTDTSVKDCEPIASSNQPYLTNHCNNISQSSVAERTSSRSSKSKNRQDDGPLVSSAVTTAPTQISPSKSTQKIKMPQAPPSLQLSFGTIQVAVHGESGLEMSDQPSSLLSEDTHGKVNSQLKPQHARRMPRSQQVNNKLRTNDAAVWAPVRPLNKVDVSEDATANTDLKQGPESGTSAKNDNPVHGSSRSKRAEMERYIPKPVAKELAEQVGMQPIVSSVGTSTHKDNLNVQPVDSATVDAGSLVELEQGLVKHSKTGKAHGAWRQRVSTEYSHAKNIRQRPSSSSSSSDPSKSYREDVSRIRSKPEPDQFQAVTKSVSEMNDSGSEIASLNSVVPAPEMHHAPKDAVITGKGKRYSYGGHKRSGNGQNNDNKNISSAESDSSHVQSHCPDINQPERAITPKENRATPERAPSQWQPKAYAHSVGQKGNKITGSQGGGGEVSKVHKKDNPLQQRRKTSPQHNESNEVDGSHSGLVSESKAEGNHEPRRGRNLTSYKSLNQNPVEELELGVADSVDVQHLQQFSAGSRRNANHVNRSGRGHESHGDLSAQGNRQHDRPRHMHYEYQPVGSLDYKKTNFEGQGDAIRNAGSRNRGRGHSHPRRGGGNFRVPRSEHLQVATD